MSSLLLLPTLAAAAAAKPDPICKEPRTQLDINYCSAKDFERADAELNAQWRATLQVMRTDESYTFTGDKRPTGEATLREAQRAWITFRGAHCAVKDYDARGGSLEPFLVETCRAELTRQRTRQLKDLVTEP